MKKRIVVTAAGGLIATVVGDLLLSDVPKSSDLLAKVGSWAWSSVSWIWAMLLSSHSMPGWAILVVGSLALFGLIIIGLLFKERLQGTEEPHGVKDSRFRNYTEDVLDGVRWRWRWRGNRIADLFCFCLTCDAELVYDDGIYETHLICERCPSDGMLNPTGSRGRIVTTVRGGGRGYAVDSAEREINRRIRTGER